MTWSNNNNNLKRKKETNKKDKYWLIYQLWWYIDQALEKQTSYTAIPCRYSRKHAPDIERWCCFRTPRIKSNLNHVLISSIIQRFLSTRGKAGGTQGNYRATASLLAGLQRYCTGSTGKTYIFIHFVLLLIT